MKIEAQIRNLRHSHKEHRGKTQRAPREEKVTENELAHRVIGIAIGVHSDLGPGLLERAYEECLFYRIGQAGLFAEKQKAIPLV